MSNTWRPVSVWVFMLLAACGMEGAAETATASVEQSTPRGLARLEDIEAIKQLKARYLRSLDLRLWDEFATVWAEDAVLEVPELNTVIHGRDAIVAFVKMSVAPFESVHLCHTPELTHTGPHSARGVWAMFGLIAVPGTNPLKGFQRYGYYHEEYVEQDNVWLISRSRLDTLRTDLLPGGFP